MSDSSSALLDAFRVDFARLADQQLHHWSSSQQVALHAMHASITKKFALQNDAADKEALRVFHAVEERNKAFRFNYWSLPTPFQVVLGEARSFIDRCLEGISPMDGAGNSGPGSSARVDHQDYYRKHCDGRLSATSMGVYRAYVSSLTPRQKDAERIRAALYPEVELCEGSSLSCVPKTQRVSRTICSEPSCNMWLQKRMEGNLLRALRRCGIDLTHQQTMNRHWARQGSMGRGLATIDLSSASDTLLPEVVSFLFPKEWYSWLNACRSKSTILPDGTKHDFALFTSMGNATTFPVQTLVFASLLHGVYQVFGNPGPIAVNGDDIIVTEEQYAHMSEALTHCGFIVNNEKSYSSGYFRESCGGDYWHGVDVRGVYIKKLDTLADWYSALNRVQDWCLRHDLVLYATLEFLVNGVRAMTSKIHRGSKLQSVPYWEFPTSGYRDPCFKGTRYKALVPVERKLDLTPFSRGLNESGLILAFLRGDLDGASNTVTLRSVRLKHKRRTCTTFYHDGRACNAEEFLSAVIWGYAKGH